jgi:two-component system response regulator RegA
MESSVQGLSIPMAASALIVEPILPDALFTVETVSSLGFHVTVADNFHDALERLRVPPALLIADIRLGEYNGLHLVLRGKAVKRDLAAIVTSAVADSVLQSEAEQLGATFVLKPTTTEELRAAICRTLLRTSSEPIHPPFERRQAERRTSSDPFPAPDRRVGARRRDILALIQQATPNLSAN